MQDVRHLKSYVIKVIGSDGTIKMGQTIGCLNDAAAVAEASVWLTDDPVQVWADDRLVASTPIRKRLPSEEFSS
jgi:hypothetical protein